jgi:hypothetical protein
VLHYAVKGLRKDLIIEQMAGFQGPMREVQRISCTVQFTHIGTGLVLQGKATRWYVYSDHPSLECVRSGALRMSSYDDDQYLVGFLVSVIDTASEEPSLWHSFDCTLHPTLLSCILGL